SGPLLSKGRKSYSLQISEMRVERMTVVVVVGGVTTVLLYLSLFMTYDDKRFSTRTGIQEADSRDVASIKLPCAGSHDFNVSGDSEVTRRLVETNLRDAWFFFSDHMKDLQSRKQSMSKSDFQAVMKEGAERIKKQ
ncbi:hypothetical protein OTU49_002897, partial [Cherax quadricarinatus]